MTTHQQQELKEKEFDKKYGFISLEHNEGEYKNWEVTFLLLTKKERENLIKNTYGRMRLYNRKYKPNKCAGYSDKNGKDI